MQHTVLGVHGLPKGGEKAGCHGKLEDSRSGREELFVTILASLSIDYGQGGLPLLLSCLPSICWAGHTEGAHSWCNRESTGS